MTDKLKKGGTNLRPTTPRPARTQKQGTNNYTKRSMDALRYRSGSINSKDRLVSLLYSLLRDHISPSTMEKLVIELGNDPECDVLFTNGYLAAYAMDLADRIRGKSE